MILLLLCRLVLERTPHDSSVPCAMGAHRRNRMIDETSRNAMGTGVRGGFKQFSYPSLALGAERGKSVPKIQGFLYRRPTLYAISV